MKVQIFSSQDQQKLAREIEALLRARLYQHIRVEHMVYDEGNEEEARRIGRLYLELMRASTITADEFGVVVENRPGIWGYWDSGGKYMLRLRRDLRSRVFPSVGVMNRMVMVPRGIDKAFDAPTGFSYLFRPLDELGVVLANFDKDEAIRRDIARIAAQIKSEVVSLARRHMSQQRTRSPDLEALARLLGVDEDFVKGLQQKIMSASAHLVPIVTSGAARLGKPSTVKLEIRNESEDVYGMVRVEVRAPPSVMSAPLAWYLDFSPGKSKRYLLEFEVEPKTAPFCPLELTFLFDGSTHDATVALILDVMER